MFLRPRFADGKQIMRVPLDGTDPKPIGIGDATVRSHFYSMQDETGQRDNTIEDLLSDLEDQAARVLKKVIDKRVWPLPIADRAVLGEWVAAQYARIPAVRRANNEIADQLLKMEIALGGKPEVRRRMEARREGPVSDEEVDAAWAELTDFSGYYVELPVNDHLLTTRARKLGHLDIADPAITEHTDLYRLLDALITHLYGSQK
jgi:hypothetical protein